MLHWIRPHREEQRDSQASYSSINPPQIHPTGTNAGSGTLCHFYSAAHIWICLCSPLCLDQGNIKMISQSKLKHPAGKWTVTSYSAAHQSRLLLNGCFGWPSLALFSAPLKQHRHLATFTHSSVCCVPQRSHWNFVNSVSFCSLKALLTDTHAFSSAPGLKTKSFPKIAWMKIQ